MADRIITVTDPSVVTNDTLDSYNNYSDQDGLLGSMTPAEAAAGKTVTLSDGVIHSVTTKPVGTTNGEFTAVVSNAVTVDLTGGQPSVIVDSDLFTGTTIDTGKWAITQTTGTITQNDQIIYTMPGGVVGGTALYLLSNSSVNTSTKVHQFEVVSVSNASEAFPLIVFGAVGTDTILFDKSTSVATNARIRFQIGSSVVDTQELAIPLVNTWKFVLTPTAGTVYYLSAPDTWTQAATYATGAYDGITAVSRLGGQAFSGSSNGDTVVMDNWYLCNDDYATSVPV